MTQKNWFLYGSLALNAALLVGIVFAELGSKHVVQNYLGGAYSGRMNTFKLYPITDGDIVMLGDSITQHGNWEAMFPDINPKNRGASGMTTPYLRRHLDDIIPVQPSAVFVLIGTNDLIYGPGEDASYQNYRAIIESLRHGKPQAELYLQSILPLRKKHKPHVEAFNAEIKKVADEYDLTYIDLYPSFLDDDGSISNELSQDEVHLNAKGYQVWRSLLAPYMKAESLRQARE